jgi:hypothetical protein
VASAGRLTEVRQSAGRVCLAAIALILVVWTLAPAIPQDQSYHQFADRRPWLGLPNAADVLSNLAFAIVGVVGVARLLSPRRMRFAAATEAGMWFIALGIIGTALGSAWYHHAPTNATLVWDRLPMTVVFAGVLGAAISQRLGNDVGQWALVILAPLGLASVVYWALTGDLSLYVALQLGGIAAVALLLAVARDRDDPIPWLWVIAFYVMAKIAEAADVAIWDATHGLVAGHTLKHLLAAAAVAAAFWPLRSRR